MTDKQKKKKSIDLSKLSKDELREFLYREVMRKSLLNEPSDAEVFGYSDPKLSKLIVKITQEETVKLTRRIGEVLVLSQKQSNVSICPRCRCPVPRTKLTVIQKKDGNIARFCTLCETEFQGR